MSDIDDLRHARDKAVEIARNLLATPGLPATPTLQARLDELAAVSRPRIPPPYEDGYVCGNGFDDAEHASWTHEVYETREEAIADGNADIGWRQRDEGFETARIRSEWFTMPNPLDADNACDRADQPSDWGEATFEHWQDRMYSDDGRLINELQAELDGVWERFETRHALGAWGYYFDDVESHEFGDEPDEDATCSHEVHEVEIPSAIAAACVDDALIEKLAAFDPVTENAKRHEADHDGFTCAKCGAALHIEAEYDPSALCHECTHAVLDALVAEVAEHRKHAKDATP